MWRLQLRLVKIDIRNTCSRYAGLIMDFLLALEQITTSSHHSTHNCVTPELYVVQRCLTENISTLILSNMEFSVDKHSRKQGSWGLHGAHLGPTGARGAPCWPHKLCYQGYCHFNAETLFLLIMWYYTTNPVVVQSITRQIWGIW